MNLRHAILPLAACRVAAVRSSLPPRAASKCATSPPSIACPRRRCRRMAACWCSPSAWSISMPTSRRPRCGSKTCLRATRRRRSGLTPEGWNVNSPAFSDDGGTVYFLSAKSGSMQLYAIPVAGRRARQLTDFASDVGSYKLSPDGKRVAFSVEAFADCRPTSHAARSAWKRRASGRAAAWSSIACSSATGTRGTMAASTASSSPISATARRC